MANTFKKFWRCDVTHEKKNGLTSCASAHRLQCKSLRVYAYVCAYTHICIYK